MAGSHLGGGFGAGAGGGLRAAYAAADWNGGNGEKKKYAAATEKSHRLDADGGGPLTPLTGVNGSFGSRGGAPAPAEMRRGRDAPGRTTAEGGAGGGFGRNIRA